MPGDVNNVNDREDQITIYQPRASGNSNSLRTSSHQPSQIQSPRFHDDQTIYEHVSEHSSLLGTFPYSLVMKITTSEPRDVLQSERTCLTFIRFSTALFFTSLGIILNFRLDSSGTGDNKTKFSNSTYSKVVSFLLLFLSFSTLVINGVNYFVTVDRYANHKIKTYSINNFATVVCMTTVIVALMGINMSMIIESYLEES